MPASRAMPGGLDLALDAAHAEPAGDEDAVGVLQARADLAVVERLGVHPVDLHARALLRSPRGAGPRRRTGRRPRAGRTCPRGRSGRACLRRRWWRADQPLPVAELRARRLHAEVVEDEVVDALGAEVRAGSCRRCRRRAPRATASTGSDGEQRDLLRSRGAARPRSGRRACRAGCRCRRSSLTECWVGFVLSSPAWPM